MITDENFFRRRRDQHSKRDEPSTVEILSREPPFDREAEMGVIGSILLMPEVCDDIASLVADDFYDDANRRLYETLRNMHDDGDKIDITLLVSKLRAGDAYEKIGGAAYLGTISKAVPNAAHAVYYADIVAEKAVYRKLINSSTEILRDAYEQRITAKELMAQAEQRVFAIMDGRSSQTVFSIDEMLHRSIDRMEARLSDDYVDGAVSSGLTGYDDLTGGLHGGELTILAARPSMGKAQPLDASVLTPGGFVAMGDLRIGDAVASIDGRPSVVAGIFPQGVRPVYRITFSDGRSCECCAEHLWRIRHEPSSEPRVVQTDDLIAMLDDEHFEDSILIDTFDGSFGSPSADAFGEMNFDPRSLGRSIRQLIDAPESRGDDASGGGTATAVTTTIPKSLLDAPAYCRVEFLEGLLGDRWRGDDCRENERGGDGFRSARLIVDDERLADRVVSIVRSLGGIALKTPCGVGDGVGNGNGDGDGDAVRYVCRLQRRGLLSIRSIRPSRVTATQCIAVSHPDHLYVTDDYVVTHNTALAMNIAEQVAIADRHPVLFVSLEMSGIELADRMLCSIARVNGHQMRAGAISSSDRDRLIAKANEISQSPLYIDDSANRTVSEIAAAARRIKRTDGSLGLIVIDYLQLIQPDNSKDPRQEQVAKMARRLKGVSRELNVPLLCLSQLNRQAEDSKDHRPKLSHLRESGAIEQDADVVMFVHREEYYHRGEDAAEFAGQAEVIIAKQRNGPIDTVKLSWEGEFTRFTDRAPERFNQFDDYAEFDDGGGF